MRRRHYTDFHHHQVYKGGCLTFVKMMVFYYASAYLRRAQKEKKTVKVTIT